MSKAKKDTLPDDHKEIGGVLEQHRERMDKDPEYREAALTPPGTIGANPNITVKDQDKD